MIFDTHIHLNDEKLINELDSLLIDANKKGVSKFLCVGWDLESSKKAVEIAEKYDNVFAAIGIMPTSWKTFEKEKSIDELRKLAQNKKVVAIGEIGLDYYWEKTEKIKELQKEIFVSQIGLANECGLPVSIHCRDAIQDCYDILKSFHVENKGIMHCFAGSFEMAKEFVKLGYYIAFGGTLTFKNSTTVKDVFCRLNRENIVFETDAPYLAPTPFRGQINKPEYIYETIKYGAQLLNLTIDEMEETSYINACKIFHVER